MERTVNSGEIYRHFKNKMYQIVAIAEHSETKEQLVIYRALYGTYGIYARPLEMFLSEVDHEKYPDVTQKYRFTRVEPQGDGTYRFLEENFADMTVPIMTNEEEKALKQMTAGNKEPERTEEELKADPALMRFLDAKTMEDKYQVLLTMRETITDKLIDDMAVVVDVVIPDGELSVRYDELKHAIHTKQKYESVNRLR